MNDQFGEMFSRMDNFEMHMESRLHRIERSMFASDLAHFQKIDAMIA